MLSRSPVLAVTTPLRRLNYAGYKRPAWTAAGMCKDREDQSSHQKGALPWLPCFRLPSGSPDRTGCFSSSCCALLLPKLAGFNRVDVEGSARLDQTFFANCLMCLHHAQDYFCDPQLTEVPPVSAGNSQPSRAEAQAEQSYGRGKA